LQLELIRIIKDKGHGRIRFVAAFQEFRQAPFIIFVICPLISGIGSRATYPYDLAKCGATFTGEHPRRRQ
jgi:hypothetical protein